jgi:Tol biopolymer transport system component
VWVNRQGTELAVTEDSDFYEFPQLSPDGEQVTLQVPRMERDGYDIWVYNLERGSRTRLTFQPYSNRPIWTPDGTRITFASNRSGSWSLYWKTADGIGEAEPLLTRENSQFPMSWSPDGKTLAFTERNPDTGEDVWVLSLEGDTAPLLNSPFNEGAASFSPDGLWLAYVSNESGREEVYVQPYPGPGKRWQISNQGGREPAWSTDGQELFYRNGEEMMAVSVETKSEFKAGTPSTLFKGRYVHEIWPNYDVSPDDQRFLMIKEAEEGQDQINVVLNWTDELKRLVPTDN